MAKGVVDQNQIVFGVAVIIIIAAAAAYILLTPAPKAPTGPKFPDVELVVQQTYTTQLPDELCYLSLSPASTGANANTIVTFVASFFIINMANESTKYPASIYLVFNNTLAGEEKFYYPYESRAMVYGGKKEFGFSGKVFKTLKYSTNFAYGQRTDINYKLVYCDGSCTDPLLDGKVIYSNSTSYCCRLPSEGFAGNC